MAVSSATKKSGGRKSGGKGRKKQPLKDPRRVDGGGQSLVQGEEGSQSQTRRDEIRA
jgi:hypothetical protein